jgi:Tfp pilus assembly protein PilP
MKQLRQLLATLVLLLLIGGGTALSQDYKHHGKRDPFVNLVQLQEKQKPAGKPVATTKPPGLPGLMISEVTVVGTAQNGKNKIVILKGTDKFTYMAKPGSKLLDGYVESVDSEKIIFVREQTLPSGELIQNKVVKQYYTESR